MKKLRVYLAGADKDTNWRKNYFNKQSSKFEFVDKDSLVGLEEKLSESEMGQAIAKELDYIFDVDMILVNSWEPNYEAAFAMFQAHLDGIPVVTLTKLKDKLIYWFSDIVVESEEEAFLALEEIGKELLTMESVAEDTYKAILDNMGNPDDPKQWN